MNNRGADRIIAIYWFAILLVVAGAVVYMAAIFYGEPYDVRDIETDFLINQIADCVAQGGKMKSEVVNFNQDNFLEKCNLTFNTEKTDGWQDDQHFVRAIFYDFKSELIVAPGEISVGNPNIPNACANVENAMFPLCKERKMYFVDETGKQYTVEIFVGVMKVEKNAK